MSRESGKKVLGIINNNMLGKGRGEEENKLESLGVPFLGEVSYDTEYEFFLGDIDKLLETQFAQDLKNIISNNPEFFLK